MVIIEEEVTVTEEKFEDIQYIDRGNYIEIIAPWLNWHFFFFAGFTALWLGGTFQFYQKLFTAVREGTNIEFAEVIFIVIGMLLVGSVGMRAVNKTYLFVTPDKLIVRHRPIPWFGNHEIPLDSIEQLYTYERIRRDKRSRIITYELYVKSKTQPTDIKILTGLLKEKQGKFIERKIEERLGIKNGPVRERRAFLDHF